MSKPVASTVLHSTPSSVPTGDPQAKEDMLEAFANPFSFEKASLLHLQGSLISDMWMEEMGKASRVFQASEVDGGDVIFTSKSAPRITSWPTDMSEDLVDALVNHLPENKAVLSPMIDVHNLDMQHFLWLA